MNLYIVRRQDLRASVSLVFTPLRIPCYLISQAPVFGTGILYNSVLETTAYCQHPDLHGAPIRLGSRIRCSVAWLSLPVKLFLFMKFQALLMRSPYVSVSFPQAFFRNKNMEAQIGSCNHSPETLVSFYLDKLMPELKADQGLLMLPDSLSVAHISK